MREIRDERQSKFEYAEAITRLANHANLADEKSPHTESLLWALWNAERTGVFPELDFFVEDIVSCLESVNYQLNGPVPSQTVGYQNDVVLQDLSYTMACLESALIRYLMMWKQKGEFTEDNHNEVLYTLFVVSHSWEQVLAGDIDNLREDILLAYSMML